MFVLATRVRGSTVRHVPRAALLLAKTRNRAPIILSSRSFAGRSNAGRRGGAVQAANQEVTPEQQGSPALTIEGAASESASAGNTTAGEVATAKSGPGNKPALFVLPLYRKPCFPGFYQAVQIGEQDVLDFLMALRKNGQGEYLGGFMTKEIQEKAIEGGEAAPLGNGGPAGTSQGLRCDGGRVSSIDELEEVGTVLQVINLTPFPNNAGGQVVVMPHRRIQRTQSVSKPSPHAALPSVVVDYLNEPEVPKDDETIKALHREILATMKELVKTSHLHKDQFEKITRFFDLDNPAKTVDLVAGISLADRSELQAILQEEDITKRLESALAIVKKDLEGTKLQSQLKSQIEENFAKKQRQVMLMEQMRQIKKELGLEKDNKEQLITQFQEALKDKTLPEEAQKAFDTELAKLQTLEPSSSEYNVCRTYVEWLTQLPWGAVTEDNKDITRAEEILNEDHYGLEDVKERILEHIAISHLKGSVQGKIMCLVGPPGVGKTSIGKSIARSLDRKFYRFSVGGLHDVAELRGHRRTYVGAMPGKLIQCLKNTQSSNPVILIDEIDKLGRDMRGDPSSALLEVLDPEQNDSFRDHYLDVPVDLSQVLFVCTANVLDTIPGPLLDRFEVIRIAGYVHEEKMAITKKYLLPQVRESSGVSDANMQLDHEVIAKIITDYAREAGVRQLKKLLEKVSRKVALNIARGKNEEQEKEVITIENLAKYIGQPIHLSERLFPFGTPPGVVMGLAWTSLGGTSLYIEAQGRLPIAKQQTSDSDVTNASERGRSTLGGPMKVTGQVGKVMNESSEISLTYARSFVRELAPNNSYLEEAHIHLNVPEGAIPKDGPSAGVTMTTALLSLALGVPVRTDLAMTGELTITGQVLRVGGIKEKIIAARREEVTTVILPRQCEADFHELKDYIREGITAHFVDHYDDVYRLAFDGVAVPPLLRNSLGRPVSTVPAPTLEEKCPNSESGVFIPITPEPVPVSTSLAPKLAPK